MNSIRTTLPWQRRGLGGIKIDSWYTVTLLNIIGPDLTQRMVIYQWVCFQDHLGILKAIPDLKDLNDIPDLQKAKDIPLLGYIYIDHDAGISLKVEGLFPGDNERSEDIDTISAFLRNSVSLKFRYDIVKLLDLRVLTKDERDSVSQPDQPDWLHFYGNPELNITRDKLSIDHLRADGYFDDVQAILSPRAVISPESDESAGFVPEIIWVRLESYSDSDDLYKGVLLNQPFHESGVNKNDMVTLIPMRSNGTTMLIVGK